MRFSFAVVAGVLSVGVALGLTGCGDVVKQAALTPARGPVVGIQGNVHGGQQPVSGATIQLWTVGTAGDGSAATELLTSAVLTDANGNFAITNLYDCSSATDVYLTATGGDAIAGTANPTLALMTALGSCSALQTSTFVMINEVTTVAAMAALAPFTTSVGGIGSGPSDVSSLQAAFAAAAQYADPSTGLSPGANVPAGWAVPTALINTLADAVAACINSGGGQAGAAGACGQLFAAAQQPGSAGLTNTIMLLRNIMLEPTANTGTIFSQVGGSSAPFQPTLMAAPADFRPRLTATAPSGDGLQVSASSLNFADTVVGANSTAQGVTLTNKSAGSLTLGTPVLVGANAGDFVLNNSCGSSLASGASCTLSAQAAPTDQGLRVAFVQIASSSPDSPNDVALTVNGTLNQNDAITVSGNQLLRGGAAWAPHGLNMVAFVQPVGAQPAGGCPASPSSNQFQNAYNRYQTEGSVMLTNLKAWDADSVRFQISQPGLDTNNTLFQQAFLDSFVGAVRQARAAGLNVIISIQDECQSGDPSPASYPGVINRRVWSELAPYFLSDLGVMFEMYNEPEPAVSTANWNTWKSNFNSVISTIRASGSMNVVIADGLAYATSLNGAPALTDSANEVAYAIHPYFHQAGLTTSFWNTQFGNLAATVPVIDTEWAAVANAETSGSSYYCDANTPAQSVSLMQYQQSHGVGMMGFAWDFTGSVFGSIVYYANGTTTNYQTSTFSGSLNCGDNGYGAGATMQQWFETGTVPTSPQ